MTRSFRLAWLASMICLCLGWSSLARAAEVRQIVVDDARGPNAELIRSAVVKALLGHAEIRVVSLAYLKKSSGGLVARMSEPSGSVALGKSLGVAAVVQLEIKGQGKDLSVALRVRTTADGDVAESHQFRGDGAADLASKIQERAWKQLGNSLSAAKLPNGGGKRIVVLDLSGSKASTVKAYVVKALKRSKDTKVLSDKDTKGLLPAKDASAKDRAAAAASLRAHALIGGEVKISGGSASVALALYNGSDGELMTETTLKGAGLAALGRTLQKDLAKKLAGPLGEATGPMLPEEQPGEEAANASEPDAAPGQETDATADAEPETESPMPGSKPSALEVGLGMRAFARNFRYTDDLFGVLRSYKLGAAPAGMLWLRWYPAAHFMGGIPAHLGIAAAYEQGFALKSQDPSGQSYPTTMREWFVGVRGRVPLDVHEAGVQLTYGNHSFRVDDSPSNPLVPNTSYEYARIGIDGRVRVSRVSIGAELGHRFVLGSGEIATRNWFPHARASGFDAGVRAGYELFTGFELMAGFDFRRYALSMNPRPGEANIAGGAIDEYFGGWGGVSYRIDGESR